MIGVALLLLLGGWWFACLFVPRPGAPVTHRRGIAPPMRGHQEDEAIVPEGLGPRIQYRPHSMLVRFEDLASADRMVVLEILGRTPGAVG